jgi:CubicO group peptidase (beta-lactamase class C family)
MWQGRYLSRSPKPIVVGIWQRAHLSRSPMPILVGIWQPRSGHTMDADALAREVEELVAEQGFSGVIRVDGADGVLFESAHGLANRAYGIANTTTTRFAVASGTKTLTALAVVSLIDEGTLSLATTARSLLGADLPLIADDVTVEHLLTHRSGIGDYLDEQAHPDVDEYVMPVPVHQLVTAESYLAVLDGHPTVYSAGDRFTYNNGGYVVLAILAERASGTPYHDLVMDRVCHPAGMRHTDFPRSDEPTADLARGYLGNPARENVLHLPLRGVGDGGIASTTADVHEMWEAFFAGRIVSPEWVGEMVRPHGANPEGGERYGIGFWLHATSDAVMLEGMDAGISFRSVRYPATRITHTVISNTSDGAWPITKHLEQHIG